MSSIISDLRQKFAERTWNETFQLVRRCMEKNRAAPQACELMVKSMERLQQVVNVSSMSTMKSRLEMIARQQGMGFHVTEATCYLTADLFYLEVALLPCGQAEDVKVARHGGSPLPSKSFLQLLRVKHFEGFSRKLEELFTQYNIPGDKDQKFELFTCLQYLWQDLQQISNLIGVPKDKQNQVDLINNGQFGCLIAGEEDVPLTIQFYISQTDLIQAAHVTVASTSTIYKLQAASVLLQPARLDSQG
ncbi:mediator of RNA polymerase II transcription subunit 1-like isoform X2 [Nelusetta ayraudi]|uniref:mediator of RNA polymerase II transcription subunit 1-like isoform X2 n=1 Tax=Nelusetta ayraudi TaxID=303726 RepID=UPI003F706FD1